MHTLPLRRSDGARADCKMLLGKVVLGVGLFTSIEKKRNVRTKHRGTDVKIQDYAGSQSVDIW